MEWEEIDTLCHSERSEESRYLRHWQYHSGILPPQCGVRMTL